MATIAKGMITLVNVNDAYTVSATPNVCAIKADFDGTHPVLDDAYCDITVVRGDVKVPFTITSITPSHAGIKYEIGGTDATKRLALTDIPVDALSGTVTAEVATEDEFVATVIFQYSVMRESTMLDWIKDWENNKTTIGSTYLITPKLFVGKKVEAEADLKVLTGVYIGPDSDNGAGIYGYKQGEDIFHINETGGHIGGWDINNGGIQTEDGTLKLLSEGSIISSDKNGNVVWGLYKSGEATFAQGNVIFYADGSAEFAGTIISHSGVIGGWYIGDHVLKSRSICFDAAHNYVGVAANSGESAMDDWDADLHTFWVHSNGGVKMYWNNANDYGLEGYLPMTGVDGGEVSLHCTFKLGNQNLIAGWNFDDVAIWTGDKMNTAQQYTSGSGSITLGSMGLRGNKWYIDSNGDMSFMGGKIKFSAADDGGEIVGWKLNPNRLSTNNVALVSDGSVTGLYMSASADANFNSRASASLENFIDDKGGIYINISDTGAELAAYNQNGKKLFKIKSDDVSSIAGWNFDNTMLYTGTKIADVTGFTANADSISLSPVGIFGYKWRLCVNGDGAVAGGNISWDEQGNVTFADSVKIGWNNLGGTIINSEGVFAGKISADNITAGTISTANIKNAEGAWELNQNGSGYFANGNISWGTDGKCRIGEWSLNNEGLYDGDITDWSLNYSTKSLFAPNKMRIQTQNPDTTNGRNAFCRVSFGVNADPANNNDFSTIGYLYRYDTSSDYTQAFYPVMKIQSYTAWGRGVALYSQGAIVAHEGPITERGKLITTDQQVITQTRLDTLYGSTFIVKNEYEGEGVWLPYVSFIKHIVGLGFSNGDCMYTVKLISLHGNKSFKLYTGDSDVLLYNYNTQINSYTVYAGDVIEVIFVMNGSTQYWQIVKLS